MAKVILICGKICSGKSTYAERLRDQINAVILSVDEIMLGIFGQSAGEKHDKYVICVQKFIFDKSLEIIRIGTNVILDCGFWTKEHRNHAKEFYKKHGIPVELHYIDISDEIWRQRLEKRNAAVSAGETNAYFVDEGLEEKFASGFEPLSDDEINIRITVTK